MGRDADSAPTGFEENQGTARLGNRLNRMEVAIQNLTDCMAYLVESKQAALAQAEGGSMIVSLVYQGD